MCSCKVSLVLPLKLGKSGIINPRFVMDFQSMSIPKALVKMSTAPMYSASILKRAMVGCFLLLLDMAPLLREKTNPEVDLLSAL